MRQVVATTPFLLTSLYGDAAVTLFERLLMRKEKLYLLFLTVFIKHAVEISVEKNDGRDTLGLNSGRREPGIPGELEKTFTFSDAVIGSVEGFSKLIAEARQDFSFKQRAVVKANIRYLR